MHFSYQLSVLNNLGDSLFYIYVTGDPKVGGIARSDQGCIGWGLEIDLSFLLSHKRHKSQLYLLVESVVGCTSKSAFVGSKWDSYERFLICSLN